MCINRNKKFEFMGRFDGEGRSFEILGYATEVAAADLGIFFLGEQKTRILQYFFLSLIFGVLLRHLFEAGCVGVF